MDFCCRLPKIELHAHLNGSVSHKTLKELLDDRQLDEFNRFEQDCAIGELQDFFKLFGFVYSVSNTPANIAFITKAVIKDFQRDGCVYMEIRSTPRCSQSMTRRDYVQSLMDGTAEASTDGIIVKWILSIDRRHSLQEALEIVSLAIEYKNQGVVAVDLCGDPFAGSFTSLRPAFDKARAAGLKVTLHLAEVKAMQSETLEMLRYLPDRIGHGTFLDSDARSMVIGKSIPIEVCLTSNLHCKTVSKIEDHHFIDFHFEGHPCVICTDDKGIFQSSLSNEYALASSAFSLSPLDCVNLSRRSVNFIFADENVKTHLIKLMDDFCRIEGL